jgi:hypothetical protein
MDGAVQTITGDKRMLGDLIIEGKGKRTGRRVIAVHPSFNVEVSFEEMTTILGVSGMNLGTYTSTNRPDGSLDGEGQGVFASMDGEIVTWKGIGTGKLGEGGKVSYRGCLTFSTASSKLARMNGIAGAFEFEVDAAGNTVTKIWEWK